MRTPLRQLAIPVALLGIFAASAVPTIAGLPVVGGPMPASEKPWRQMRASEVWQEMAEDRMRYAVRSPDFMDRLRGYLAAESAALESVRLAPGNQGAWVVRAEAALRAGRLGDLLAHTRMLLQIAPFEDYRAGWRIQFASVVWNDLKEDERQLVYRQIRWAQWSNWISLSAAAKRQPEILAIWEAATRDDPRENERRLVVYWEKLRIPRPAPAAG